MKTFERCEQCLQTALAHLEHTSRASLMSGFHTPSLWPLSDYSQVFSYKQRGPPCSRDWQPYSCEQVCEGYPCSRAISRTSTAFLWPSQSRASSLGHWAVWWDRN